MKEIQKVSHYRKKMAEFQYAEAYWRTLSDSQQELIYQQAGWD